MSRYSDQVLAKSGASQTATPLPGAFVYVYQNAALAALTDDAGNVLPNPLTTDAYGGFSFNVPGGYYDLRFVYGGKTIYEADGVLIGSPRPKAVFVVFYGQSLTGVRAPAVTTTPVNRLLMFNGGFDKELFSGAATFGNFVQSAGFYSSLVPWQPNTSNESPTAGVGIKVMKEANVDTCLVHRPGRGAQSVRMLHHGWFDFQDLVTSTVYGVKLLEAMGYDVEIRFVWDHGQANADQLNDGNGTGEAETTIAQYKFALQKMYDAFKRVAYAALGRPVSPVVWLVPMTTGSGGAQYTALGIQNVIEAQRQAVRDSAGYRWAPAYSQFATLFNTDLVHPLGQTVRYHAEAVGLVMSKDTFAPPQMIAPPTAVDATHTDVTFDQDVLLDVAQTDASGFPNSYKGFELFITSTQYAVTAISQTSARVFRLTHASCSTSGRIVKNGCQWIGITGAAATYMPRTHVISTTNIGTAEDGTVLKNYAISQVIQ